jgi:hypothetical protein
MKFSDLIKMIVTLLVIVVVFGAAMFGLNFHTAPLIEANNAGAELAPLLAVMPEGATFGGDALIYDAANASASTLKDVPASVLTVYKESAGLGYVIRVTASSQYSKEPMEITVGIAADGKICGIQLDKYTDSIDFRTIDANYTESYIGKDSALADVGTVSGCTFSTTAFKNAVTEAMGVLISNDMIAAGVKSDAQILQEMIPTVAPGFTKLVEATASGNVEVALKAENDTGFAFVVKEGESSYLAIVNAIGVCKVYDVEGNDVTENKSAVVDEATALAAASQSDYTEALTKKVQALMPDAADIAAVDFDTFNTVVSAVTFKIDGADYYAFYSRSIGFHQMNLYIVVDANGAIAKIDADQFIFEEEYFMTFGGMDVSEYKQGFEGITSDAWTGDQAIIATATMTSNAMKESTTDAFATFDAIIEGGAN